MSRGKNNRRLPADDEEQSNLELLLIIPTSQVVCGTVRSWYSTNSVSLSDTYRSGCIIIGRMSHAHSLLLLLFGLFFFSFSRDIISQTRYVRVQ